MACSSVVVCAEAEPSGLPVHMRSRTLAHHGVLLRLAPAEVCRNQREDNAVGAPSLAEGSQASTSFSAAMNRSRLSRESMKCDEEAFKSASPPIPAASHSVARAGMRSGGMGSNRSGCQPLERPLQHRIHKAPSGCPVINGGRSPAASRRALLEAFRPPRSRSRARRRRGSGAAPELADPVGSVEVGRHKGRGTLGRGAGPRASRRSRSFVRPAPSSRDRNASTYQRPPRTRRPRFHSAGPGYVVAVTDQHDCQPPTPEAIGQIWTCPVCEDSWVCKEGAVIGGEPFSWVRQPAQTE
jgi:hypothetical protein